MITEDYVSYEVAKLLKEKGFDEPVYNYYKWDGFEQVRFSTITTPEYEPFRNSDPNGDGEIACPTHQMALKWLREVHKISYEEAVEAALKYCLTELI